MKTIRWGILACGKIAHKFCSDLALIDSAELVAVASRDLNRAQDFAEKHNAKYAFDSYEELVESDLVDIIYIASPHSFHFEHTMLCLENGKSVLCEKPIAVNAKQAKLMYAKAKEKNLYLMEAMWTKFLPHFQQVKQWIANDEIGKIQSVKADFGFKAPVDLNKRLFNPNLAGGALLDIGIYPVMAILEFLGKPNELNVEMQFSPQRIDTETKVNFLYENQTALAECSFLETTPTICEIIGDKGSILLHSRFHENSKSTLYDLNKNILDEKTSTIGFGYAYMIQQVCNDLLERKAESKIHSSGDSLQLIQCLDNIRKARDFKYPFEE